MADEPRRPFVRFFIHPVEDRNASLEKGYLVTKDIDFIEIVPHGSEGKLAISQPYAEWLAKKKADIPRFGEAVQGSDDREMPAMYGARFPMAWIRQIEEGYKAWKQGQEIPVEGTALKQWGVISPALLQTCLGLHIRTIEELAECTDDVAASLGMGGITLRERARNWLKINGGEAAKTSAQIEKLRADVVNRDVTIAALQERIARVEAKAKA